ncbi:hypothetical protein FF38_06761 [Lucilia cuprina]|uniref:Uncharacterized protein n=1 Tax=Lucilia cuprina TaxID=7375 RepID=A0A0L0CRF5_LUCCU|nr:hypothetical protein CVS40_3864 [Lucilia cuprina]KNC34827.1 hypothetical protein FF38_06761 [Lucilia cuprina]
MSKFTLDSILSIYFNMLQKTQLERVLPEFSEIYLRLSFKENFGKNYLISSDNLQLYRKLLVLHYCEEYPSLTSVIGIMERCFSVEDIYNIVAEREDILCKWWEFKNNCTEVSGNKAKKPKIC